MAATAVAVSIRARHCCRANLGQCQHSRRANSVSIRARHCCRANRHQGGNKCSDHGFQSAPGIAAGRINVVAVRDAAENVFQSAPGIAAGRIRQGCECRRKRLGFNPRPALLPGESRCSLASTGSTGVSIRARHCCRANRPALAAQRHKHSGFNPRPALLPGESNNFGSSATWLVFQSAPGIAAGRIDGGGGDGGGD